MSILFESVVDETLKDYSPYVFEDYRSDSPTLKKSVRNKILKDVGMINDIVPVQDFFIKGSILTKQYTKDSDIDVYIQVDRDYTEDILLEQGIKEVFDKIDNTKIEGIPYPFQYYITYNVYNMDNTEAAYDVRNDDWIKKTASKNLNIDEYMEEFQTYIRGFRDLTDDLRMDLIDYTILKEIPKKQLKELDEKVKNKFEDIQKSTDDLIQYYNKLRDKRNEAFSDDMDISEIKKYGVRTRLPANVIFKLIERYKYKELIHKIKNVIGKDNELDLNELDNLNKLIKKSFVSENLKERINFKTFLEKDEFGRREHRQQRLTAGLKNTGKRKSQNILPKYQRKTANKDEALTKEKRNITVSANSPRGKYLIKKYRIGNPVGTKTVGGNENDPGFTITFK